MNYEELKNSVIGKLVKEGFELSNTTLSNIDVECLTKTEIHRNQIVINGQPSVHDEKHTLQFVCLGEGSIDDIPTIGYKLYADKQDMGDFWLSDVSDLKTFFNIR